jgi:hypothetical protein
MVLYLIIYFIILIKANPYKESYISGINRKLKRVIKIKQFKLSDPIS